MAARSWQFAADDYAMALDIDPSDPDVWFSFYFLLDLQMSNELIQGFV